MGGGIQTKVWRLMVLLTWLCSVKGAGGQLTPMGAADGPEPAGGPAPDPQYTLHAYTNLIQVPVLVLRPTGDRFGRAIAPEKFAVSIDSGPWFRPTHVRVEGDDALSLAILLDPRGNASKLMKKVDEEIGSLAPGVLHPADRVTLYGLDCELMRSGEMPVNPMLLREQVDAVLQAWKTRTDSGSRCTTPVSLQNSVNHMITRLNDSVGRRILLVITEGDQENRTSWQKVALHAEFNGTAVFAIAPKPQVDQSRLRPDPTLHTDGLDSACQTSGGTLILADGPGLSSALARAIHFIRERYIIEFPRASNATMGRHSLEVRIDRTEAIIRPSGISVPLPDPKILNDPTTVHSTPGSAPVQGNRPPAEQQ